MVMIDMGLEICGRLHSFGKALERIIDWEH